MHSRDEMCVQLKKDSNVNINGKAQSLTKNGKQKAEMKNIVKINKTAVTLN